MNDPAIRTTGLRKRFGDHTVLDGLDLTVERGTVHALLGQNGAGKTTTVKILSTLLRPDSGRATVAGRDLADDPAGVRAAIGVTGQFSAVDNLLTAEENLRLMADLRHLTRPEGRRRASELLERLDLTASARKPASTLSGGQRRRLDLAMTLVGAPEVIFLDEPTTGLDPSGRREVWRIVRELVAEGTTVLLTTQHLEEADQLAHRVALLHDGSLAAEGTPEQLKRRVPGAHVRLRLPDRAALAAATRALGPAALLEEPQAAQAEPVLRVAGDGTPQSLRALLDRLDEHAVDVTELSVRTPDLDDVFLALTGHGKASTR
ncbi:daunorubicin resistance protein DrrA family ABC transporter ATP-binding protein [Actinosynnema pretiosum subsp. pretiosum]|uniref:Daunorubicin resistance ABC transporter ATPase subunit n=2 Tax=Actinosynnema TaxID=40566 RepID=C6WGW3_ACTMD|nr:daunorubicin resistance protein DrrA family ABC transporter ATP-binding protein [Actinosynnema mirum]ACU36031.1 daunorubicin resistance ABC transporter ATPase subunit [Actinosynnema mirum DSM 43827]AXX29484.1 ABC transporter, ATP-binding component [Actinosynnema pretiosum subsp. pretiosum]QUF06276.1 daunorubicin resistance protein DrrA family ABC transporter ATP-binding protein [Actinosynnema pretiosum subsp. pretiosum]